MAALLLPSACSTTSNLPEDEILYTGISEFAYDHQADKHLKKGKKAKTEDKKKGVITSLAEAYTSIDDLLNGSSSASEVLRRLKKEDRARLSKAVLDSLEGSAKKDEEALNTAKEEAEAALSYAPNNSIFGSSKLRWPFPFGLWMYNRYVKSESKFGKFMFKKFAADPVFITTVNPQLRIQVAKNAMRNYGFFRSRINYDVITNPKDSLKAQLAYSIYPGPLFRLGSLEYRHFPTAADSIIHATIDERKIHVGDPFNVPNLDAERKRLSIKFRNEGFYFFRPEYIGYRADTVQVDSEVQLQIQPKPDMPSQARKRYYMGRTNITVLRNNDRVITDSATYRGDFSMRWVGGKKPPIRFIPIRRNLFYRRGSLYKQDLHDLIQGKLSSMGVFSGIQMNYVPRDTSLVGDTLDVEILAILDKPFDSELEAKLTNKSTDYLGPGLSYGITKRNAFRGAESLTFKIYGSYEWKTGMGGASKGERSLLNCYELGTSLTLTYPRMFFFGIQNKLSRRAETTTNIKLDVKWENRASYFKMVSYGSRLTYTYQRNPNIKHEITPFRLDYDVLLSRTERFDSIMNANPALMVSMRNQFVPSMSYSMSYSKRAASGRTRSLVLSAKEAGNGVSGIYAIFGKDFYSSGKSLFGVPFAQFLRLSADYRETYPIGRRQSLAARAFVGVVWSYGNSSMAPYADLFSVGGANSIRAFGARTLGPGSYNPGNSNWSYLDQMGDFKMEANLEYRFPIVSTLFGALFVDAGNVWLIKKEDNRLGGELSKDFAKQIALGTGFGFRYDLEFLVVRFDIGIGIHAPYDTGKSGYYNIPNFWKNIGYHLAIGYPF
ncbi:MAG: BamA/TamA family outer membrane protein [Bacteroidaceae bacterium]|nr:BamA/TamA family outer membrane protein [Bacteroidaceae bacterium]